MIIPKSRAAYCKLHRVLNPLPIAMALAFVAFYGAQAQQAQSPQPVENPEVYGMLTYSRGQPVIPAYEGE